MSGTARPTLTYQTPPPRVPSPARTRPCRFGHFLLGVLLGASLVMVAAHYRRLEYAGTARLERRTDPAAVGLDAAASPGPFSEFRPTLAHDLAGYQAVAHAAEELGLSRGVPRGPGGRLADAGGRDRQQFIQRLTENVSITWEATSDARDLIQVSFRHHDPQVAADLPNALVRDYIAATGREIIRRLTASRDFLRKQVAGATQRFGELLGERLALEGRRPEIMPESFAALVEETARRTAEIERLRRRSATAELKLAQLRAAVATTTGAASQPAQIVRGPNPEFQRLSGELQQAERELQEALAFRRMTEKHATVQTLRQKIARLRERIGTTPEEIVLHTVWSTETVPKELAEKIAAVEDEVRKVAGELEAHEQWVKSAERMMATAAPERQEYLRLLDREKELKADLDGWKERLAAVQMSLAAEAAGRGTHLNAVELARRPLRPQAPTLLAVVVVAVIAGLLAGGAFALLPFRHGRGGRACLALVSLTLLAVFAVAASSARLRWERPDLYAQWRQDPLKHATALIRW